MIDTASSPLRSRQPSLWRLLYRPMLVLSLALHSLILAIRLPADPPAPPEPEPSPTPALSMITSFTKAPPPPPPTATPKPQPTPKATPPKPQPSRSSIPPASPKPQPTPAAQPSPSPSPSPVAPTEPTALAPETAPELEEPPVAEPTPELDEFLGQLQQGLGQLQQGIGEVNAIEGAGIPYYLFEQPEQFFTPESLRTSEATGEDPEQLAGIEDILWASRQRPEQVYESLQSLFAGFTFTEQPEYGGGSLYEVKKGNTTRYLTLVRATDKTATFVVIWNRNPHQPTVAAN